MNIAIFVSGSGTNCENLIKHFSGSSEVCCALVVSNKSDAYALVRAERLGVPTAVVNKTELHDEQHTLSLLRQYAIDFIVLAGFLPLIPDYLISRLPHCCLPAPYCQSAPGAAAQVWRQGHVGPPCARGCQGCR